jgi:hypothetical protein
VDVEQLSGYVRHGQKGDDAILVRQVEVVIGYTLEERNGGREDKREGGKEEMEERREEMEGVSEDTMEGYDGGRVKERKEVG